jgi:hypothetical protein
MRETSLWQGNETRPLPCHLLFPGRSTDVSSISIPLHLVLFTFGIERGVSLAPALDRVLAASEILPNYQAMYIRIDVKKEYEEIHISNHTYAWPP